MNNSHIDIKQKIFSHATNGLNAKYNSMVFKIKTKTCQRIAHIIVCLNQFVDNNMASDLFDRNVCYMK